MPTSSMSMIAATATTWLRSNDSFRVDAQLARLLRIPPSSHNFTGMIRACGNAVRSRRAMAVGYVAVHGWSPGTDSVR